jgi:hypothetical protein
MNHKDDAPRCHAARDAFAAHPSEAVTFLDSLPALQVANATNLRRSICH